MASYSTTPGVGPAPSSTLAYAYGGVSGVGGFQYVVSGSVEVEAAASVVGDVNGDGYADVGLLSFSMTALAAVPVVRCGGATSAFTRCWSRTVPVSAIAPAGDVNGDGLADILTRDTNNANATIYAGSSGPPIATFPLEGGGTANAAAAGDVDGDGYSDILVGVPSYTGSQAQQGRARLYRGGP
jgi:hypothetical protein